MFEAERLFNNNFLILYLCLAFCLLYFLIENILRNKKHIKSQNIILLAVCTVLIFLFGLRDFRVGIDNEIYLYLFESSYAEHKDFGFKYLTNFLKTVTDKRGFIFVIAALYMVTFYLFIRKWNREIIIYLFFMYISLFFFKNMGMNAIRQGLACSFFLFGLVVYKNKKYLIAGILFFIGFSFQATIIIPIIIWYLNRFISLKMSLIILSICSVFSISSIGIDKLSGFLPFLSDLFENRFDTYINKTTGEDYIVGFRPDFFLFNWLFVFIGLWINRKIYSDDIQLKILKSFILISGIFFLYFNLPYSDRIGLLSWIFIPLIFAPIYAEKTQGMLKISNSIFYFILFLIFVIFPSK